MKLCLIVFTCCLLATPSLGQNANVDTLSIAAQDQRVSAQSEKLDSIQHSFYKQTDSLKLSYQSKFSKMDSVQQRLQSKLDSLTLLGLPSRKLQEGNIVDSLQRGLRNNIDSLTSSKTSRKIKHTLDSISHLRSNTVTELNGKLQTLKDKTVRQLDEINISPEISDRIAGVTRKVDAFEIAGNDLNVPSLNVGLKGDIPALNNPNLQLPSQDLTLGKGAEFKNIDSGVPEISKVTGTVGQYGKDVQQLSKGNLSEVKELPKAAEAKAEELSGLNEVKDQTQALDQYKDMPAKMQNPDSIKEFAVEQVRQVAVNHFAGKEQQLKEAMETISKYKAKYTSLNSISEITKRPPNEMKGKPLIERLVPGIAMQVQKRGEDFMVDFNPSLGYRFTGKLTAGLGWNQRVAYSIDAKNFNPMAKIYGPRAFGEFKLWKGFSPRAELEVMNTTVPPVTRSQSVDPRLREWVWGAFVGVKKQYKFVKNVQGTALIMVRLFNPDHKSPYADVLNVRFGFDFPMKKKTKV